MDKLITLGKHADTLKQLQKQLSAVCEGIKKVQAQNNAVLSQAGLDPKDLKGSLEAGRLPLDLKKDLLGVLEQDRFEPLAEANPFLKSPKNSSKRLNV